MKLREKFNVNDKKTRDLFQRMKKIGLVPEDIEEKISSGGGSGGQKVNKTSNRVQLKHLPSGISVVCRRERLRNRNRFLALRMLVEKLEYKFYPEYSSKRLQIEKKRKQKGKKRKRARMKAAKK